MDSDCGGGGGSCSYTMLTADAGSDQTATLGDIIDLDDAYGIPDEAAYIGAYCRRTGRGEIENWHFYLVLSLFRFAAIVQGVYYRGIQGNASSPEAAQKGDLPRTWSELAWAMVEARD
jgi:aminoglycoside phosphotransferase (APT) family kinase protein